MKSEYFVRISPKGQSKALNVHSEWGGQFFYGQVHWKIRCKNAVVFSYEYKNS